MLKTDTVINDRYKIEQVLATGGLGVVYQGYDLTLEAPRAIKIIREDISPLLRSFCAERFRREAQALAQLGSHQNVAAVYDYGESPYYYIVMELVEGEPLSAILRGGNSFSLPRALSMMRQICSGIGAAHRLNIVHRDLKPANVLVSQTRRGELTKVIDFGIAKLPDADAGGMWTRYTNVGMMMGTPEYMAPEQADDASTVKTQADVYSLGILMYELLTGFHPFESNDRSLYREKHRNEPPPAFSKKLNIPPAIEKVVRRAVEKTPNKRYRNADELEAALSEAFAETERRKITQLERLHQKKENEKRLKVEAEIKRLHADLEKQTRLVVVANAKAVEAEKLAEAHARTLEEEQLLARLESTRRTVALEAQTRAEQAKRIKEEIEMFRRLEDEELPRLEAAVLQRKEVEARFRQLRERYELEQQALASAEQFSVSESEGPSGGALATNSTAAAVVDPSVDSAVDEAVDARTAVPPAIAAYLSSIDPYKRAAAVAELGRTQSSDAFSLIANAFDDSSAHVRNAAARALRRLEPGRTFDLFKRVLEEGSPERQHNVGAAIASSGVAAEAIDLLVSKSREETYDSLSILFVMAKTGEVQPLVKAIEEHENDEVRRALVRLLNMSGQAKVADAALQRHVLRVPSLRENGAAEGLDATNSRAVAVEYDVNREPQGNKKQEAARGIKKRKSFWNTLWDS